MSSRREKRRSPNGEENWYWIVDFVFRHVDGRRERIRRYSPVNNRRGAEQYERSLREELMKSDADDEKPIIAQTLREFWEDFDAIYIPANNKYSEAVAKRSALRVHLLPAFGCKLLSAIDEEAIERYKSNRLKLDLRSSSINYQLATLRTMLRVAVEWCRLRRAPRVKLLKLSKDKKMDFLDFEEAKRLVVAANAEPAPAWASMIVIALNTGLRVGELLALRWVDCDLDARQIIVSQRNWRGNIDSPKSGKGRVVPLNSLAIDALRSVSEEHELVWRRPPEGRPRAVDRGGQAKDEGELTCDHLNAALRRIRVRAGLRHFGWHTLRHTFASHMVMRGASIKELQEVLGHSSIEMTMRYAHLSPQARVRAVDALVDDGGRAASHGTLMAHRREPAEQLAVGERENLVKSREVMEPRIGIEPTTC